MTATDLEHAPVVSTHNEPQPSPQEWPCGCVTAVYVTDRDHRHGERPFEMRLAHPCDDDHHLADDVAALAAWNRQGDGLSTLDLRAAQHAAERTGQHDDAHRIAREIQDREDLQP